MSLLMNALKKAEKAKQSGQPGGEVAAESESNRNLAQELGLDPPATHGAGHSSAMSSTTMEPAIVPLNPTELSLEPGPELQGPAIVETAARTPGRPASRASANGDADRGSARAVFSAKSAPKASSKKPFYTVVGVSLLATAGYGAYLWMQMSLPARPITAAVAPAAKPPLAPPQISTGTRITEPSGQTPTGTGSVMQPSGPPDGASPSTPRSVDDDVALPRQNLAATRREDQDVERSTAIPLPRASKQQRDVASAVGGAMVESPANLRISRNATPPTVNPDVLTGYAALQAGDLDRAGQAYERALRSEPANRDAMLGAATVLLRLERTDAAEAYFRQLLRLHPNDTYATAQLAALTARGDPVSALSQVNSLIAQEAERPEMASGSGALAFVQGNQLAAQGRWPEAQQAYFNAHRADPGNADYCYNLAISLDRIREPRLARDFYRKALELSRGRVAGFDVARAQLRLDQIDVSLK
jgi:Flp pilus assembly protein TadD